MKSHRYFRPRYPSLARRGSALVIVLAFVLLLTGLIVAFLFKSTSNTMVSAASANNTRADLFGQGAIDTIIGDLKQEIANATCSTSSTAGNSTLYIPTSNQYMVPTVVLPAGMTTTTFPNVLKESVSGTPFSPGDTTNTSKGRASGALTTTYSLNNRAVTANRWNKPLLMPKNNNAQSYALDPTTGFVAPNWILVARDGSNPTAATWNANLEAIPANATLTTPVIGRFAYIVYNEGGLLDANVAGSPVITAGTPPTYSSYAANKNAEAYADLTQLPGFAALSTTDQQKYINTLVGWRNFASAGGTSGGVSGQYPTYAFGGAYATTPNTTPYPFDLSMLLNTTGFMRTATSALDVNTNASDRQFMTRQQLIQFMQGIDTSSKAKIANIQTALQYLGTFSRDINQPSLLHSPPNLTRPPVLALASGGNDQSGTNDTDPVNGDNPSVLNVRVATAYTRNDGTPANVGDPLVKRFPLSNIAWITYLGPSALRNYSSPTYTADSTSGDSDIYTLENTYGVTQQMLKQGTAAQILNWFGLTWTGSLTAGGYWTYTHAKSTGGINTLAQVAALGRDPDFFELLKAAITVGALGKGTTANSGGSDATAVQNTRDTTVDYQIMQIGANIISQATVDGYPVRIQFGSYEFRGVKNLPYFYRARNSLLRTANPVISTPPQIPTGYQSTFYPTAGTLTNTGTFHLVQMPEIWNPHAYDATSDATVNSSMGNPRPAAFDLVAWSNAIPVLPQNGPPVASTITVTSLSYNYPTIGTGTTILNSSSTELTFQVPVTLTGAALYREPTLLNQPNIPTGSGLAGAGSSATITNVQDVPPFQYVGSPLTGSTYLGIDMGSAPVASAGSQYPATTPATPGVVIANYATSSIGSILYQVRYRDPSGNYQTYDEKYFRPNQGTNQLVYSITGSGPSTSFNANGIMYVSASPDFSYNYLDIIGIACTMSCMDPRTSRFGLVAGSQDGVSATAEMPPGARSTGSPKWVQVANNYLPSNRPDWNAGFGEIGLNPGESGGAGGSPYAGWGAPPTSSGGWNWDTTTTSSGSGGELRQGLFSQNLSTFANNLLRFSGDSSGIGTAAAQYYSDADGVTRKAMGGWATATSAATTPGLPMATAYYAPADVRQVESRPIILNRPYLSVAELGHVFSDTPWKNLDMSSPESGYNGLLDIFCINATDSPNGLVAGKVNLNTSQAPVIQAILAGAYRSPQKIGTTPVAMTVANATTLANALIARTSSATAGKGPLMNVAELVGKYTGSGTPPYDGFSADLTNSDTYLNQIPRYRESAIRALSAVGQTRVWNLMIDVVAQTGRYPVSATGPDNFVVEGEQRYWVHVAIDRFTGQVLDRQIENVKE